MGDLNNFLILGFNYKNLDISEREKIQKIYNIQKFYDLKKQNKIKGFISLATCLRIEFYLFVLPGFKIEDIIEDILEDQYKKYSYVYTKDNALSYLFNIICGGDSIIIGENQILAQIKKAYAKSIDNKTSCNELNSIFNHAVSIGKKFRFESKIDSHGVSLERCVFLFLKNRLNRLENKKIFIVGTGDLSRSLLYVLEKENIKDIVITNRSIHNLSILKNDFNVKTIDFKNKYSAFDESEIILSATSAPHLIFFYNDLIKFTHNTKKKIIIDLAVPRDVDEKIGDIEYIDLYNIEDVFKLSDNNMEIRKKIYKDYEFLIKDQEKKCVEWFDKRKLIQS